MDSAPRATLSQAVGLIISGRRQCTSQRALAALIGKSAAGALHPIAARYWEAARPIDDGPHPGLSMGEDYECSIHRDFWRASHAAELARSDAFETDSVAVDLETADYDLPYRMRKHHECVGQRMQLVQRASGITFSGDEIGELIFETDWDPYLKHFASRLPSGPTSKWKWDDAIAQLVVDIARDPSVLAHGVGAIKCRLEEAFLYVGDDYPERSALYNFARLIAHKANIPSDEGAPAD